MNMVKIIFLQSTYDLPTNTLPTPTVVGVG